MHRKRVDRYLTTTGQIDNTTINIGKLGHWYITLSLIISNILASYMSQHYYNYITLVY